MIIKHRELDMNLEFIFNILPNLSHADSASDRVERGNAALVMIILLRHVKNVATQVQDIFVEQSAGTRTS